MVGGDFGLQVHDGAGSLLGVRNAGQLEGSLDVTHIGVADFGLVLVAVVGLVRQTDATLTDPQHLAGGVAGVGLVGDVEESRNAPAFGLAEEGHQVDDAGDAVDLLEERTQWLGTSLLDDVDVHVTAVELDGDLNLVRGGLVADVLALAGRQVLEDLMDGLAGLVVELVERAVTGAVFRDDGLGYPGAVHVAVEVLTGGGVLVEVTEK